MFGMAEDRAPRNKKKGPSAEKFSSLKHGRIKPGVS